MKRLTKIDQIKILINRGFKYNPKNGKVTNPKGRELKWISGKYYNIHSTYKGYSINVYNHVFGYFQENGNIPYKIYHINGNKLDNRINNLRAVSQQENQINEKKHVKGYHLTPSGKYQVQIWLDGKRKAFGTYTTEKEAKRVVKRELERREKINIKQEQKKEFQQELKLQFKDELQRDYVKDNKEIIKILEINMNKTTNQITITLFPEQYKKVI